MNKLTRITSATTAGVLAVCALTGCSAYSNPGKYITVPEKGTLTLKKSEIDKSYEDEIYDILDTNFRDTVYTELTDASETVKDGDEVCIRYTGRAADESVTLSESALKGMTNADADEDTKLVIGSGKFIGAYENKKDESKNTEGFEEQLIGWKKGQSGDITVTFPDSYSSNPELQGVVVIFNVTINKVSRAYVADDSTVKISYEFEEDTDEEEKKDGEDEPAEASETKDTEADGTAAAPETKEEEDIPSLSDVFKKSTFTIDYTKDIEDDAAFNDLFSVKDYASLFKEQAMNFEHSFEFTVTEENIKSYKDNAEKDKDKYDEYIGRTFTVKLTVTEITSLPEWTDELVSEYTNEQYKTVTDFEEYMRKSIIAEKALTAIVDATVVDSYPKRERDKIYKQYVDALVRQTLQADPSSLTQAELDKKLTAEVYAEIYASAATSTLAQLKQTLVYEYLFDEYDIKLSNKEYKEQLNAMFSANAYMFIYYYGIYDASSLEAYYGKDDLELQFKANKLAEVLGDYVVIDEAN